MEYNETKFPAPDGDPSVPSGHAVVPCPQAGRGPVTTSKNGLAALARVRAAGYRVVARAVENLASGHRRSICRVCSFRPAGRCAESFDCLVYSG